jgi:hypothetical protein
MTIDWLQPESIDIYLFEDGAKLIGILSWTTYFLHTGYSRLCSPYHSLARADEKLLIPRRSSDFKHEVEAAEHSV